MEDMKKRQKEVDLQFDEIIENGHECLIREIETFPTQLEYCGKEPCEDNPNPENLLKDLPLTISIQYGEEKTVIELTRLRKSNWQSLAPAQVRKHSQVRYQCDFCQTLCDMSNPIYTHRTVQNYDLCSDCVRQMIKEKGKKKIYSVETDLPKRGVEE